MRELTCDVCFRHCTLREGMSGFCRARKNVNGENICASYGRITSLALDPIEKKPLARFYPGSKILSVGSYGCNLSCPFCQNWRISMQDETSCDYETVSAAWLAELVNGRHDSIGIAFTYNEPLIEWEFIRDTAELVHPFGKKVVLVSNGCAEQAVLEKLEHSIDAMNIDLKGDAAFYRELGGSYEQVKHTIEYMHARCHTEITSLIIPGKNDDEAWIAREAEWLASLSPDIPLHITRYFPNWQYDIPSTPRSSVFRLTEIARKYLHYVYPGNI